MAIIAGWNNDETLSLIEVWGDASIQCQLSILDVINIYCLMQQKHRSKSIFL